MQEFYYPKDPRDADDFGFDWRRRLASGETIAAFTPSVTAGDAAIDDQDDSGSITTVRLTGGTVGTVADILFSITTSTGRILDETGRIFIRAR